AADAGRRLAARGDDAGDVRAVAFAVVAVVAGLLARHGVLAAIDKEILVRGDAGVDHRDLDAGARVVGDIRVEVAQRVRVAEVDRPQGNGRVGTERDVLLQRVPEAHPRVDVEALDLLARGPELERGDALAVGLGLRA